VRVEVLFDLERSVFALLFLGECAFDIFDALLQSPLELFEIFDLLQVALESCLEFLLVVL
jgi:hypothetical protein